MLEPLAGYLRLGVGLDGDGRADIAEAWNFGPDDEGSVRVADVVERFRRAWPDLAVELGTESSDSVHEAGQLRLDSTKARTRLGWRPCLSIDAAIDLTTEWYDDAADGPSAAAAATDRQIARYMELLASGP